MEAKKVGINVKRLMEEKDITEKELAEKMGINIKTLSKKFQLQIFLS